MLRHPFGKVPALDHDGMRSLETSAITRYLDEVLPGKSLIPGTPKHRARVSGIDNGRTVLKLAMDTKGASPFLAGDLSLADLYLAPIAFYLALTPDKDGFDVPGFADWWARIQALPSYQASVPKLG